MRTENIEKMLSIDNYHKRKAGRGVYSRASRLGFIKGGVKTQYDFLTAKQKKMLNSEVRISNMYEKLETIPPLEEIEKLDYPKITSVLSKIKSNFTIAQLTKHWGISCGKLYLIYEKYGVYQRKTRQGTKLKKVEMNNSKVNEKDEIKNEIETNVNLQESEDFFEISLKGCFEKEDIESRLINICEVLIKNKKYRVHFSLKEEMNPK